MFRENKIIFETNLYCTTLNNLLSQSIIIIFFQKYECNIYLAYELNLSNQLLDQSSSGHSIVTINLCINFQLIGK